MIFIVDDDFAVLEFAKEALSGEGHVVMSFDKASDALEQASTDAPELIISDVMMPEIGGFEFKKQYVSMFPHRTTPFIFMSSLSDPEDIVKGLDSGADDYLIKPVNPAVLQAKVRSILRLKKRYAEPVFYGDLSKLPFVKLLQFCELKGFTGKIEISGKEGSVDLPIKGGSVMLDQLADDDLEKLYDQSEGTFVIYAYPPDFSDIEGAALQKAVQPEPRQSAAASLAETEKPMGRLSGVRAEERLFQLQTEFITYPDHQVVTIVIHEGRVMMKRSNPVAADRLGRKAIEKMIEEQHTAVENEVREKVGQLMKKKMEAPESLKDKFSRLFESGFERHIEGKLDEALALWEEAFKINPNDRILATNLRILKKKMNIPLDE